MSPRSQNPRFIPTRLNAPSASLKTPQRRLILVRPMRSLILLSLLFAGYVSASPPFDPVVGVPEFRAWCGEALTKRTERADHAQFRAAYGGDARAVSAYYREAHALEMSSRMAAAREEFLQWTLE